MATELEEIKLQVAQARRVLAYVGLATGVTADLLASHARRLVLRTANAAPIWRGECVVLPRASTARTGYIWPLSCTRRVTGLVEGQKARAGRSATACVVWRVLG